MKESNENERLLGEYKRYIRFDFCVIYACASVVALLGGWLGFVLHDFQGKYVEPRKERLKLIKRSLPLSYRRRAFAYFCLHYGLLIVAASLSLTILAFVIGDAPSFRFYMLLGIFALLASTGFIPAYYGIVEGQEMDSLIWSEEGYKKKNDPKERLKHPF